MRDEYLPLPRGFCPQCMGLMSRGCFRGLVIRRSCAPYPAIEGGYCPHNEVAAIRLAINEQKTGPWRMISPALEEDLGAMMHCVAGFDGAPPPMPADLH